MVCTAASDEMSESLRLKMPASFGRMIDNGHELGVGVSTTLGWFRIEGLMLRAERCAVSIFVRSCDGDEKAYAYTHNLKHTSCVADINRNTILCAVVRPVSLKWT